MNCVKRVMLRLGWIKTAMADLDPLTRLSKLGLFWSPSPRTQQNSLADPDLFCRIQTFFSYLDLRVESGLSCRIRTFLSDPDLHVGSEPCLSDPDLQVESGPFLLDLDLLVGTEPFFVGSGPSCRIRTYLSDPDLLVRSGPSCWIREKAGSDLESNFTQTKTVKFSTKRLTTVWNKLNNIFFPLSFCFSDYALEKESKEIIKSGPPPPR